MLLITLLGMMCCHNCCEVNIIMVYVWGNVSGILSNVWCMEYC